MAPADIFDLFAAALAARAPDAGTSRTYQWAVRTFLRWLDERSWSWVSMSPQTFQNFVSWLGQQRGPAGRPWSPRSIRTAVKGVEAFYCWAEQTGYLSGVDLGHPALPEIERPPEVDAALAPAWCAAADRERDPTRAVLRLLPLIRCRLRDLCAAPLAGVGSLDGVAVLHVRPPRSGMPYGETARLDWDGCLARLQRVTLAEDARAELVGYLKRASPSGLWLFPGSRGLYLPDTAVRAAQRRIRKSLS